MNTKYTFKSIFIATALAVAMLFIACKDRYKRVLDEAATKVYPQGVAHNFEVTYTEIPKRLTNQDSANSKKVFVLRSPLNQDFENLAFKHQLFPKGVHVDYYDKEGRKNTVVADQGIIYAATNLIDLQGNVVLTSHDGKKLETDQLYWDRAHSWIFTEEPFTYTNPQDGTVMDGEGMDFNNDFTYFTAHKTYGLMTIKEDENND